MTYRVPEADRRLADVDRMRARAKAQAQLTMGVMTGAIQQGQPVAQVTGFAAKFPGKCVDCKSAITVGQYIRRAPVGYAHTVCPMAASVAAPLPAKVPVVYGLDLTVLPEGDTYFAVDSDSGSLAFMRVSNLPAGNWSDGSPRPAGWVFTNAFIGGQGNSQRLGKQRPGGRYVGQWENLLGKVLADPKAAAKRFADELGICCRCHLPLTDETSRALGMGPICAGKVGW